jgi:rfaE bifunctional protein nucleotidyltransferase chain/domain
MVPQMSTRTKLLNHENLRVWCDERRAAGQRVVSTNGCFDVLHAGHVELLHQARALGECLIVAINSDASVKKLKGESRPVNNEEARAFVLSALNSVDAVVIFDEDTPIRVLEEIRPSVHVKGGDYRAEDLPENQTVRNGGGEIVIVPLREGFSTTATLQKLGANTRCHIVIPARYGSTRFPASRWRIWAAFPSLNTSCVRRCKPAPINRL